MTAATAATAATADAVRPPRRSANPILRATRLQFVAWPYAALWPWGILALSFAVNVLIYALVSDAADSWTGGLASIYVVQLVGYLQVFTRVFPFATGMSVTRRSYYLGAWLAAILEACAFGAVLLVLRQVEDATNGWGLSLEYFGLSYLPGDGLAAQYAVYTVPFLLMAGLGAVVGLVKHRWGTNGTFGLIAAAIVGSGLSIIVIARAGWWGPIQDWFADRSAVSLFAGWPLPFAALLALVGFAVIRRTTP